MSEVVMYRRAPDSEFTHQNPRTVFNLERLSNYGLGRLLIYGPDQGMDENDTRVCRETLTSRFGEVIERAVESTIHLNGASKRELKDQYLNKVTISKTIVINNMVAIVGNCLRSGQKVSSLDFYDKHGNPRKKPILKKLKPDYEYTRSRKVIVKTPIKEDKRSDTDFGDNDWWEEPDHYEHIISVSKAEERETNTAIFTMRMQESLPYIIRSNWFKAICEDHQAVKAVVADPDKFSELEKLCQSAITHFMTSLRLRYVDKEVQLQEGLFTIWACAKKYEGRDFSRFSTMVRKALKNKQIDLLRFHQADVRRIHKHTHFMGSGSDEEESYLTARLGDLSFRSWQKGQALQLTDEPEIAEAIGDYDPFFTLPIWDKEGGNKRKSTQLTPCLGFLPEDQETIVTDDNFPHFGERRIYTYFKDQDGKEHMLSPRD